MTYLKCKECRNKGEFVATCVYRYMVDSNGNEITAPEMDGEPEYQCEKCGSTNIEIDFRQ
jgi:Zn finger protein HypA/HybF involved in hydrogenase expression